jgi:hypothetical protein
MGRYPAALRDAVVEYATKAKEHGKSHAKVVSEVALMDCAWIGQAGPVIAITRSRA